MAKKTKKKSSNSKSKSWVDKVFSFKKILVYSLIITLAAFYSTMSSPSTAQVEGASTTGAEDYTVYSQSELNALAKADPLKYKYNKYYAVELDLDKNKNGVPNGNDTCLPKTYVFTVNGNTKKTTQSSNCDAWYVKVPSNRNCNTVEFKKTETHDRYDFSYIEYETGYFKFKHVHTTSREICGFPEAGGDEVGYLFNRVSFGVKAH